MTAALAVLLLATAAEKPAVVSVHAKVVGQRAAVEVVTTATPGRVGVERVGADVVLTLDARLPEDLGPIAAVPPLQAIEVRKTGGAVSVRVRVDGAVPHEVRRQGTLLTVLFGEGPPQPEEALGLPGAEVQELYRGLLPAPVAEPSVPSASEPGRPVSEDDAARAEVEGLQVGLLTLRPSISGLYIDAETALLETAQPLADRYYEVRPQVAGELPLGMGRLRGDYEARMRRGSRFALVENTTTHLANASLEVPVGPNIVSRAGAHFARGLLETTEVDPGREYFFQLGRYTRYDLSAGLRVETGSRVDLDLSGTRYRVTVDENAGFFDHEVRIGTAGLGLELGPRLRGVLAYSYEEIPFAPARPEAHMRAHSGSLRLTGEILPLVTGFLTVGYRDQRNPGAGAGGTHYEGLSASARLLKEFSRSTTLLLTASRSTPPSAFESNGFFVATSVQADLNVALPLSLTAHAGAGYHWNEYRVSSPEIGRPREDRIASWSAGLGRSITAWIFARADYRYERRDSNLERFDTDAHSFSAQVGVRLYRPRERR